MIIRYPTALYLPGLPQEPEESGNVTYTISNNDPPRTSQTTTKLPPAIELRKKSDLVYSTQQRRAAVGGMAFSISKSSTAVAGSAKKQFEIGQVLDFTETDTTITVEPMLVSKSTEIQHDTNILDLASLGITEEEVAKIYSEASTQFDALRESLNGYRQTRADTEVKIAENKKVQNENRKALESAQLLVIADPTLQSVVDKLEENAETLQTEETELIALANTAAENATVVLDKIRQLAQVVR